MSLVSTSEALPEEFGDQKQYLYNYQVITPGLLITGCISHLTHHGTAHVTRGGIHGTVEDGMNGKAIFVAERIANFTSYC